MLEKRMIQEVHLRYILNSNAGEAVEADVRLENGFEGRASCPTAILSGRRERKISSVNEREELQKREMDLRSLLSQHKWNQDILDRCLSQFIEQAGTDICLAVSLAFARAAAMAEGMSLAKYISFLLNSALKQKNPKILIPVFSGGVHQQGRADSFQQIMAGIEGDTLKKAFEISKGISDEAEKRLKETGDFSGIASSGGYLSIGISTEKKLCLMKEILDDVRWKYDTFMAVDIAAEHLIEGASYWLDGKKLSPEEFYDVISGYIEKFCINFVEDPFDSSDVVLWKRLMGRRGANVHIIGDDLFATQEKYVNSELADGAVVKMNQAGTLSDTLNMIRALRNHNMAMCVSHRSYETEDTAMCDLAFASVAEYAKIGGVRRGERIIKYNQLLRLEEEFAERTDEEE